MTVIPFSLRLTKRQRIFLVGLPLAIGFITPSLTLLGVQCLVGDVPLGAAIADVIQKQFARGHYIFVLSLIGLIPFVVLALMMRVYIAKRTRRACYAMCISGLVGILALMIPVHVAVWYPLYGPGRGSSTDAIAFIIIPFYCIVTLFFGLLIGRLVTIHQWFRTYPEGCCMHCGYDLSGNVSGKCPECGETIPL